MDAARKARLQLKAVDQYINELELDKDAMLRDMKKAASDGLCEICANLPEPARCFEADFDCAVCTDKSCRCKSCTGKCENFAWRGRK